jgi:tetratricopeptide (TPR) repeat protein
MSISKSFSPPQTTDLAGLIQSRPWFAHDVRLPNQPKGMLGKHEAQLCYYLARDAFNGSGVIVDAGSFLGKSAYFFAEGLRANPCYDAARDRIHCFDNFLVNEGATVQFVSVELNRTMAIGDSTREIFASQVSSVSNMLEIHAGDFHTISWAQRPIEILMVDIAKSPSLGGRVAEAFFSSLIPGESLVIHQDYHHPWLPHIHVTMEHLAEYFDLVVPRVDDSAVFRCREAIPPDVLQRAIDYDFSHDEKLLLMDQAIDRLPPEDRYYVELARIVLRFGKTHETGLRAELSRLRRRLDEARPDCASNHYFAEVSDYLDELEGWRCKDGGDFERCLQLAEKAIAQRPTIYSMTMRGIALRELGRCPEAVTQLREALELGPPPGYPSGDTYIELALTLSAQERYLEAEASLLRGLRDRNAGIPSARYCDTLASIWSLTDAGSGKTALLDELHREFPQDPEFYALEAWLRERNGDPDGAARCLSKASQLGLSQQRFPELRSNAAFRHG